MIVRGPAAGLLLFFLLGLDTVSSLRKNRLKKKLL